MTIIVLQFALEQNEPAVSRRLQVPADTRPDRLHLTTQAAMGWINSNSYMFEVGRCPPEDVGGFLGCEEVPEAMGDPNHPEHADLKRWYAGGFDPNKPNSGELRLEALRPAKCWKL